MPWAAMVRYGPNLVASAARLLAAADSTKHREQNETIAGRLDQLENASAESAKVIREIAEQIQVLAAAQQQTVRRCRTAILLAVAAAVLGVGECTRRRGLGRAIETLRSSRPPTMSDRLAPRSGP